MIKRILQIGIALCIAVIITQFILASYWKGELVSSYHYGLAISAFQGKYSLEVSDGRKLSIPDGYRVGSWPANGGHGWSIIHDEPGNVDMLNVHLDRFFRGPLVVITGLSESITDDHCDSLGRMTVCDSDDRRYRYISEQMEASDQSHACERVTGSMDSDGGGSFVEFLYIKVPGRPEVLSYSGSNGTAMSFLELIGHVLGELSSMPSTEYLVACLGGMEREL